MDATETKTINKTEWPTGEWTEEYDNKDWVDELTKYDCQVIRNPELGTLCGYVGIGINHPLFGVNCFDRETALNAHGGITFSSNMDGDENFWWFGFDCAHSWDVIPAMKRLSTHNSRYRNVEFVESEVRNLAAQLKVLGNAQ